MKANTLTSATILCLLLTFSISCQKNPDKYVTYVYGSAELREPYYSCRLDDGKNLHFPIFSFQNNPDSIGIRDFSNCKLYFTKEKEYYISYQFILYTYADTILFDWEDSGQYFIDDKDYYHFESNTGQSWESLGIYWDDRSSVLLYTIPNEKKWTLQLEWAFKSYILEKVVIN